MDGIYCVFYTQNSVLVCRLQTQWKILIEYIPTKNLMVSYPLSVFKLNIFFFTRNQSYFCSHIDYVFRAYTTDQNTCKIFPLNHAVTRILRVQKLIIQTNIWLLSGSMSNLLSVRGTYWKLSDGPAECETLSCVLINIKTAEKGSRRFTSLQARLCTLRAKLDNNGT